MNTSKITSLLLAASMMLSCSCSEESLFTFSHKSDPDYTPEGINDWKTHVFVFSGDVCKSVQTYNKLSECQHLDVTDGDKVAVVATESMENVSFTSTKPGNPSETYSLASSDMTSFMPRTWAAVAEIKPGMASLSTIMKPVYSEFELSVKNAPEAFRQVSLSLEGLNNSWNISTDTFDIDVKSKNIDIVSKGEDLAFTLFPMNDDEGIWPPKITISLEDEDITPELDIDKFLSKGVKVSIDLDFSDYIAKGTFDIIYSFGDMLNPYSTKVARQTIQTSASIGIQPNIHYMVQLEKSGIWRAQQVHDALCSDANKHPQIWNDWTNSRGLRDTMSYCLIDSEFPAKIRVRKLTGGFSKVEVRPSIYNIDVHNCGDNTIEFTLPSEAKGKISVEFDDDRQHNLFIYAREPDMNKPSADDPKVKYFGKGEHNPGVIFLTDGQTLYIDHGAKVYANVKTRGSDVTIAGHGILSGEKMVHKGDNMYSWGDFLIQCNMSNINARNLTVKDITMIDSPGWNMIIPKTDGVLIDGINMISWELNGDGIDVVSSKNIEIKNCFIRTYDDCLTLKCRFIVKPIIDVCNVNIHDCLIWADYARGIVIGPEAGNTDYSGRLHDIDVRDCIFLQHKRGLNDDQRSAFAIGQGSDGSTDLWKGTTPPTRMSDITVTNMIFDNIDASGRNASIWQYGQTPVLMENVTLTDFKVLDNKGNKYPALHIKTNGSSINNLKVKNFTVNGVKVDGIGDMLSIDKPENVDITIE